jgi:hypothetical protein
MAEVTSTQEVKFTDNELWCAMEHQVRDLVSDRAIQYLTKQEVLWHLQEAMDETFSQIESLVQGDGEQAHLLNLPSQGFANAIYLVVQLVLEEVLPEIHLKPEWKTNKLWTDMVKEKRENNSAEPSE